MEAIEKIDFEKVGKRMKKLRKEQRISQDQVAKDLSLIHISEPTRH